MTVVCELSHVVAVGVDVLEPDERALDLDRRTPRDTGQFVDDLALECHHLFEGDALFSTLEADGLDLERDRISRQRTLRIRLGDEVDIVDAELHLVGACEFGDVFANGLPQTPQFAGLEAQSICMIEHRDFGHFSLLNRAKNQFGYIIAHLCEKSML